MSKAVPELNVGDAALDAQCLVTSGYGMQCIQRIYLVQIGSENTKFHKEHAVTNWEKFGHLPLEVLLTLLTKWRNSNECSRFNRVKNADENSSPLYQVDIGLTFSGLEAVGVPQYILDVMRKKAPAFTKGAYFRAARQLGDTGPSDPILWQEPYRGTQLHLMLFVHSSRGDAGFPEFEQDVIATLKKLGAQTDTTADQRQLIESASVENSVMLEPGLNKVHFGFIDGISTPVFKDFAPSAKRPLNSHCLGELLLGYRRNDGSNVWRVPKASHQEGTRNAAASAAEYEVGTFFLNGTFGAFRKIAQDTTRFEQYLETESKRLTGDQNYVREWLKAKMLGRWPNGDVVKADQSPPEGRLLIAEEKRRMQYPPPPVKGKSKSLPNDFDFTDDRGGHGCPFGAHIRRMNPRKDSVTPFIHRPLLRRGVAYGTVDATDKGILGLFLCASLEEQFEHLLGSWADNNPVGMPFESSGKDPIIGNHEQADKFEIPRRDAPAHRLGNMDAFVKTLGTSYLFFPSLRTLDLMAQACHVAD